MKEKQQKELEKLKHLDLSEQVYALSSVKPLFLTKPRNIQWNSFSQLLAVLRRLGLGRCCIALHYGTALRDGCFLDPVSVVTSYWPMKEEIAFRLHHAVQHESKIIRLILAVSAEHQVLYQYVMLRLLLHSKLSQLNQARAERQLTKKTVRTEAGKKPSREKTGQEPWLIL